MRIIISVLVIFALTQAESLAQYHPQAYGQAPGGYAQQPYQASASFVPAGTPIGVRINETLGSEFTTVGDSFSATLGHPLYAGGQLVAEPGSTIQGTVVAVTPAGRGGKPGSLDLRLTSVITTRGQRYPLSASIDKANYELSAEGGRLGHMTKATAVGAGAGALSGLVGSAVSGGKKGKGAALGTGIGAGVGLLGGAIKKGNDFILKSGTNVPFVLDQPLQVNTAPRAQVQQYAPEGYPQSPGYQPGYQPQPGYATPPQPGYAAPPPGAFGDPGIQQAPPQQQYQNPYL